MQTREFLRRLKQLSMNTQRLVQVNEARAVFDRHSIEYSYSDAKEVQGKIEWEIKTDWGVSGKDLESSGLQ